MSYPANTISLYKIMMDCQRRGTFTENNLLDFMQHFWYNGSYDEYYHGFYVSKKARGA